MRAILKQAGVEPRKNFLVLDCNNGLPIWSHLVSIAQLANGSSTLFLSFQPLSFSVLYWQ